MKSEFSHRLEILSARNVKERVVLFFGREYFSDNTKYLYLRALEQAPTFTAVWCSSEEHIIASLKEQNLPCHLISPATVSDTLRLFLTAAVAVFSVNPSQSLNGSEELFASLAGARHIQLWHGISVKHLLLGLATHLDVTDYAFRRPLDFASRADCVLSPSSSVDGHFKRFFGCRRIVRAGYPRNEVILRPATENERIGSELPEKIVAALQSRQHKTILFAPTWQRGESTLLTASTGIILRLAKLCKRHNASLFIKSHPLHVNNEASRELADRCFYINPSVDMYPHLKQFDLLITDYSSIMFDFLLTKKPIMRLDIPPGSHRSFEPDFGLVPDVDFAYPFDDENINDVFSLALNKDNKQRQREIMAEKLFETEVSQASASLVRLLEHEVDSLMADRRAFTVEAY